MRKSTISLMLVALALAACTRQPYMQPSPPTWQPEMSSTQNWKQLAEQTATEMMATLGNVPDPLALQHSLGAGTPPATLGARPIHIALLGDEENSPFLQGFRDLLSTELTARGYIVSPETAPGVVVVNTWVQVVPFDNSPRYRPGLLTAGALAGYVGRQASLHWGPATAAAVAIPLALVADAYLYFTDTPNAEMLINTAVLDETRYLFKKTSIYYVETGDFGLYAAMRFPPTPIPTETRAPATAAVTVRLPLVQGGPRP